MHSHKILHIVQQFGYCIIRQMSHDEAVPYSEAKMEGGGKKFSASCTVVLRIFTNHPLFKCIPVQYNRYLFLFGKADFTHKSIASYPVFRHASVFCAGE